MNTSNVKAAFKWLAENNGRHKSPPMVKSSRAVRSRFEEAGAKILEKFGVLCQNGFSLCRIFQVDSGPNLLMDGWVEIRIRDSLGKTKLPGPLIGTVCLKTAAG